MIFKNKHDEVRIIWRVVLLVGPFLLIAFLLRYIPIRIRTQILINQGMTQPAALSRSSNYFMEDPIGSSILGILQGLSWYLLVFLLIRFIEKRKTSLKDFGLDPKKNRIQLLPLGLVFGALMYFGYIAFDSLLGESNFSFDLADLGLVSILLMVLNFVANGFGEETAFRSYLQTHLIKRHGLWMGIGVTSIIFVLLHLLISPFTMQALFGSIFLAGILGILFALTRSVYLVGTMHAAFNLMPSLLGQWPSDLSLVIVNGFLFLMTIVIYLLFEKGKKEKTLTRR